MATYITPRVQITQEFTASPVFSTQPLSAFIIGPQYNLIRYAVASEKPLAAAVNPDASGNVYNPAANVIYPYPNQVPGTTVDQNYVKVFVDSARAQYLPLTALGSNSGNAALELVQTAPSSGKYFSNRLRFTTGSTTVLQTANGHTRSSYLANRDVQVGDFITITDNLGNTLTSKIKTLIADSVTQDGSLGATSGTSLASGSDGVANGSSTFTSASGAFTQAMQGAHITVNTKGTFLIAAVNSATSIVLSGSIASASGLSYHVGGLYNDLANVQPQAQSITAVPAYAWAGSGSDPGHGSIDLVTTPTTAYVGYPAKRIYADTYTVTVTTTGSLTTARFSVASAQGAFATQTNVALASAILILDNNSGNVVEWDFTGSTGSPVFTAGQSWSVPVAAAVVLTNPSSAGTFAGAGNITYKLTVTRGGALYTGSNASTCAIVSVSSSNVDSSAPVLPQASVAFNVGTLGVTATFAAGSQNSQLVLGDVFYIDAVAPSAGAVKIVELSDSLSNNTLTLSSSISGVLSLVQTSAAISEIRDPIANTLNWSTSSTALTLNSGLVVSDANLVSGITPVSLPVLTGNVFIQHRDLVLTNVNAIASVTSLDQVPTVLGTVDVDNPIAQAVYEAVNNAAGVPVYFLAIPSDNLAGYNTALGIAKVSKSVYSVVPTSFDDQVQAAVLAHVTAMSDPSVGRWRIAWFSTPLVPTSLIYSVKPDATNWTATITDDPVAPGTQYTLVTVAGATFLTDGVRPNDQVLINFRLAADGSTISDAYTVVAARTQTTLVLASGPSAAINVATKVQIQRNFTADEQIENLASVSASYANRRVRNVFPDTCKTGSVVKNGYFLAAALAGLRSGVVPHQGITNTQILGFDDFTKTVSTFTSDQLDTLAAAGTLIVAQDTIGAVPYVRHQLTTDTSSVNAEEDSVTTNVDSVSYGFSATLAPYIGKYNNNPEARQLITDALNAKIVYYQTQTVTATAGAQLLADSKILSIGQSPTFKDQVVANIQLQVPAPINYINITLPIE